MSSFQQLTVFKNQDGTLTIDDTELSADEQLAAKAGSRSLHQSTWPLSE